MALVVETGDGSNPSANSYAALTDIQEYAAIRGFPLKDSDGDDLSDDTVNSLAIRAMDYLNSLTYKGYRVTSMQPLPFPRKNIPAIDDTSGDAFDIIGGSFEPDTNFLPSDVLPVNIVKAQCQAVCDIAAGVDLLPTRAAQKYVKSKKIGPIETVYDNAQAYGVAQTTGLDALLAPLLANSGEGSGGMSLRTVRV